MSEKSWSVTQVESIEEVLRIQGVTREHALDLDAAQAWVLPMPNSRPPTFGAESSDEEAAARGAGLDLRLYTSSRPLRYLTESFVTEVLLPPIIFVARKVGGKVVSVYLDRLLERLTEKGQRGVGEPLCLEVRWYGPRLPWTYYTRLDLGARDYRQCFLGNIR